MLSHPIGTIAVLVVALLLVLAGAVGTWWFMGPTTSASRRPFARLTIAAFGAVATWLILIPILFRIFDLPGSAGPVQYAICDPIALHVFHVRGWTVTVTLGSLVLSPLLALAVVRMRCGPTSRPRMVAGVWALSVISRFLDLGFWPTV
jgi:hypothetical protein